MQGAGVHVCGWQCLVLQQCDVLCFVDNHGGPVTFWAERQRRSRLRGQGVHRRGDVRGGGRGKQGKKRKEKTIWCLLNNAAGADNDHYTVPAKLVLCGGV